jgi:selenocysteine-specific elongation factor
VVAAADAAGFEGLAELPAHPDREALEFHLRERGEVERVGERWVAGTQLSRLAEIVRGHFARHVSLDPAQFKELTGQTRRTAIPLLEWLDARGVTKRTGDVRVRGA